jgi:hypothetical protein
VSDDPTDVRSIAVRREELVTALEATERGDAGAVLRVTPPFSGRMRARIQRAGGDDAVGDPEPVHVDPAALLTEVPSYPDPDDTEDALRESDEPYSRERHRERHANRVAAWRETVAERVRDRVTVATGAGPHEVAVVVLG